MPEGEETPPVSLPVSLPPQLGLMSPRPGEARVQVCDRRWHSNRPVPPTRDRYRTWARTWRRALPHAVRVGPAGVGPRHATLDRRRGRDPRRTPASRANAAAKHSHWRATRPSAWRIPGTCVTCPVTPMVEAHPEHNVTTRCTSDCSQAMPQGDAIRGSQGGQP